MEGYLIRHLFWHNGRRPIFPFQKEKVERRGDDGETLLYDWNGRTY